MADLLSWKTVTKQRSVNNPVNREGMGHTWILVESTVWWAQRQWCCCCWMLRWVTEMEHDFSNTSYLQRSEETIPIKFNMVNKHHFLVFPFVLCLFSGFRSSLEQLHSNWLGSCGSWASLFNPHALFSQDCLSFLFNSLAFRTTTIALSANVPQNHLEK